MAVVVSLTNYLDAIVAVMICAFAAGADTLQQHELRILAVAWCFSPATKLEN